MRKREIVTELHGCVNDPKIVKLSWPHGYGYLWTPRWRIEGAVKIWFTGYESRNKFEPAILVCTKEKS